MPPTVKELGWLIHLHAIRRLADHQLAAPEERQIRDAQVLHVVTPKRPGHQVQCALLRLRNGRIAGGFVRSGVLETVGPHWYWHELRSFYKPYLRNLNRRVLDDDRD